MCASVYSSLLLFTLTTISIMATKMATDGLPLVRQERGADRGVLSGADFLSVFMSSSLRHERTTSKPVEYTRATRSTSLTTPPIEPTTEEEGVVVAVSVSSSGKTLIHKPVESITTTEYPDQNLVASEEHPSIVAESKKSEFSVEESEPITTNSDLVDFFKEYPASVQPIPRPFTTSVQPIQQTVIYHNREPGRARSVSYSTVIQSIPHSQEEDKLERRERHFEGSQTYVNTFDEGKKNESKAEKTTSNPQDLTTERNWEVREKNYQHLPTIYGKPEQNYEVDESASVMTNGRIHGIQPAPTLPSKQEVKLGEGKKIDDNQKVGYVVEGRNYRKYRVEERTSDGFIVGEYGVVSHDDGSLRGVRYTADGTISPRLIYDALMKFLSL